MVMSARRPWADAILDVGCEVISRGFPTDHRGTVAVRTSTGKSDPSAAAARVRAYREPRQNWGYSQPGHVIGTVDIVDCHDLDDCPLTGPCGYAADGMGFAKLVREGDRLYHWILDNPHRLPQSIRVPASDATRRQPMWALEKATTQLVLEQLLIRSIA